MINKNEDISHYLGTTFFIVLFFFFISAFSDNSANQISNSRQYELCSVSHVDQIKAVNVNSIQLPSLQKSCLFLLRNTNFNLFNECHKIFADNCRIAQSIILLQKIQLSIKPIPICRFNFHLYSTDTDEPPILS